MATVFARSSEHTGGKIIATRIRRTSDVLTCMAAVGSEGVSLVRVVLRQLYTTVYCVAAANEAEAYVIQRLFIGVIQAPVSAGGKR